MVSMQHTTPRGLIRPGTPLFFNKKPRNRRVTERERENMKDGARQMTRRAPWACTVRQVGRSESPTPAYWAKLCRSAGRQSTRPLPTAARLIPIPAEMDNCESSQPYAPFFSQPCVRHSNAAGHSLMPWGAQSRLGGGSRVSCTATSTLARQNCHVAALWPLAWLLALASALNTCRDQRDVAQSVALGRIYSGRVPGTPMLGPWHGTAPAASHDPPRPHNGKVLVGWGSQRRWCFDNGEGAAA